MTRQVAAGVVSRGARAAALLAALTACSAGSGDFRQRMGLAAPPPDPFLIVSRAPLEMPADRAALPRPQPGAASRVEPDAVAQAQAALLGTAGAAAPAAAASVGENALATAAGPADPAIRAQIAAEVREPERRFGLDSVFGFPIVQDPASAAERLEPAPEAERLRAGGLLAPVPPAPPAAP